jgi:hypothetical protein
LPGIAAARSGKQNRRRRWADPRAGVWNARYCLGSP